MFPWPPEKLRKPSLKGLLWVRLMVVAILPVICGSLLTLWHVTRLEKNHIVQRLQLEADAVSQEAQRILLSPRTVLSHIPPALEPDKVLSHIPLVLGKSPALDLQRITAVLEAAIHQSDLFDSILLIGSDGRVKALGLNAQLDSRRRDFENLDLSQDPFIQKALLSRAPLWSNAFLSMTTDAISLRISVPMESGALVGTLNTSTLGELVRRHRNSHDTTIAVFDSQGNLVYHPDSRLPTQRPNFKSLPILQKALNGQHETSNYRFREADFMGSTAIIPELGWVILVSVPTELARQPIRHLQFFFAGSAFLALVLALLVARTFADRMTRPLHALARSAKAFGEGRYQQQIPYQNSAETATLADSFTRMGQSILDREEQLHLALRQAETTRDRLEAILQSVAEALVVTDTDRTVVAINRAAQELFGFTQIDARGRTVSEILFHPTLLEQLDTVWKEGGESSLELQMRSHQGTMYHVRSDVYPVRRSDGTTVGMVSSLRDITQERASDRAKSKFISMAAHELRTPLTAILGYSELLIDQIQDPDFSRDQHRDHLQMICDKAENLEVIISDLLDLSRIESGRPLILHPEALDFNQLVRQTAATHQRETENHQFHLDLPAAPIVLQLDRPRIQQVLDNLVGNAVKYSPAGGVIGIQGQSNGSGYLLQIQDNGLGIPLEQQPYVFDPFYRAHSESAELAGFGLGLSICKMIVEEHGGRIWCDSEPGIGSTFHVQLPAHS